MSGDDERAPTRIHHLGPPEGAHRSRRRKGRGRASGRGRTAGRGTKGTRARGTVPAGFEGGQMPIQRRVPKLPGFTPPARRRYETVSVADLAARFGDGDEVTVDRLREARLVRRRMPVKVLGDGEIAVGLTVRVDACSGSARGKIEAAGGTVELTEDRDAAPGDGAGRDDDGAGAEQAVGAEVEGADEESGAED